MQEKELKTSVGQRVAIGLIAFLMLGSIIASYAAIIANNSKSSDSSSSKLSDERMKYYEDKYAKAASNFKEVSKSDYETFSQYLSDVKAYNETSANESGVQAHDLLKGTGRTLGEKDGDYLAYYVGWCADETIFSSSLDNDKNPSSFVGALDVSQGVIEGWYYGMEGARLGGVREITVPGNLAYANQKEVCGGYNKPLKFLVMAVPAEDPLKTAASDVYMAEWLMGVAMQGIDYEKEATTQQ